jgi:rubredoxin
MSFVRLFADLSVGWQLRGQYAFWNGASSDERLKYRLLERVKNRVAPIAYEDGRPVFHQISAGTPFVVLGLAGYWLTFDTDAMWLDTPAGEGQFAVLAVGGAAGKPGNADIDWTCPGCGSSISKRTFEIGPMSFGRFLDQADAYAAEFNNDPKLRTCDGCGTVHPPAPGLAREEARPVMEETAGA